METKRTMTVDTEMFEVGDVLAFSLNDGEKVQAMAVEETPAGMLFVLVDCLDKEYPMFEKVKRGMSYMTSDLRRNLNGEILARFPEEIKSRMVAVNPEGDLLRIPTEREIFGKNPYGEPEDESVARWKPMELRRNRIAFQGDNGAWEWYWLMNRCKDYASGFANVFGNGFANYNYASGSIWRSPGLSLILNSRPLVGRVQKKTQIKIYGGSNYEFGKSEHFLECQAVENYDWQRQD